MPLTAHFADDTSVCHVSDAPLSRHSSRTSPGVDDEHLRNYVYPATSRPSEATPPARGVREVRRRRSKNGNSPRRVGRQPSVEDRVRGYSLLHDPSTSLPTHTPGVRDSSASSRTLSEAPSSPARSPTTAKSSATTTREMTTAAPFTTTRAADRVPPVVYPAAQSEAAAPGGSAADSDESDLAVPRVSKTACAPRTPRDDELQGDTSNALVPTEASPHGSTGVVVSEESKAMKDLVSHVDSDSFGFDLRDALQQTDFAALTQEYARNSAVESEALLEGRHWFRIIAKGKEVISAEDVYDLLVLFTPCGASQREGGDFLWENCLGRSCLTFEDFLRFGNRLRARLHAYELFGQLSDSDKLLITYSRVFPGEKPSGPDFARLGLLSAADQQLRGKVDAGARPLRLYEQIFLVNCQQKLYDAELIPADEVPWIVPTGDHAHERHGGQYPHLSAPALDKESMDWHSTPGRGTSVGSSPSAAAATSRAARRLFVVPYSETEDSARGSMGHQGGGAQTTRMPPRGGKLGQSYGLYGAPYAATTGPSAAIGAAYQPSTSRSPVRPSLTAAYTARQTQQRKNMGRFVEEEYWERRTLDDHLITQLQGMYTKR